jgi:hypothetical protein
MTIANVASGWQLYCQFDSLVVDGETLKSPDAYQANLDPDGPISLGAAPGQIIVNNPKPTVHAGISSSLTLSTTPPAAVTGWNMYRYIFGLDFKTIAAKAIAVGLYYEDHDVTATAYFNVGLQCGSLTNETPQAQIMDVGVDSYKSGIAAFPTWDQAQVTKYWDQGADPSKNVDPEVTTFTQGNEGVIREINSNRTLAQCGVTVKMRAGAIYQWAMFLIWPIGSDVTVYDVYANYVLKADIAVKGAPPITSPWGWLIAIFQDLAIRARDMWDHWTTEGLPLTIIIVAVLLVTVCLVVVCYMRGRGKPG